MKLVLAIAGFGMLAVLAGGAMLHRNGAAEANVNRPLLGLWRGIDPVDGSRVMRVFAPTEDGSTQRQLLIGRDTSLTTCTAGNDPFEVGDDKATIFGEVQVGNQVGAVLTLTGDLTIDCFAPGSPGPVEFGLLLELDRSTGGLSETLLDPVTREPTGRPPIVYVQLDTLEPVDATASGALIGMWEGIDRNDGSGNLRQFLPSPQGSQHRTVLVSDTLFGLCRDAGNPADLGNDKAVAKGEVELIESQPGRLSFEGHVTLTCFTPGSPPPSTFGVRYELYPDRGMLVETVLNPETGEPVRSFPTIHFLISSKR
jgi:hypothetical protein